MTEGIGLASVRNIRGLVDDCAVVPLGGVDLVATLDTFTAPSHFPEGTPMVMVGRFSTSAALSDLAAAGAEPLGVLVGYGLPAELSIDDARALAQGVASAVRDHGGEVLGGDTKPRPVLALAVTALGTTPTGRSMGRAAAEPGDVLAVTGPLGGAGAALARLARAEIGPRDATPLLDPVPRLGAGCELREIGVRCATDLSDGLAEGLVSIAAASGARLVADALALPIHPWAAAEGERGGGADPLELAATAGGDYELLLALGPALVGAAREAARRAGCELTVVGRVEEGDGAVLETPDGPEPLVRGFEHGFGP